LERLQALGTDWGEETASTISAKSPTSLKLTFEQLRRGRGLSIEDALVMEFRMVQRSMAAHDFFEGIRALLIDKDQKPQWKPLHLADVAMTEIERYFVPLGEGDLSFD